LPDSVTNDDTHQKLIEPRGTRDAGIGTVPRADGRAATRRLEWSAFATHPISILYRVLVLTALSLTSASETRISRIDTRLQTAFEETQDGIDVLKESSLFPSAVTHLISARNLILQAQFTGDSSHRRALVQQAIAKLDAAKGAVATIAP
jgi:hypothetical protein